MVIFDQCAIKVNGTGLLAESASIQSSNSISPVYAIGQKGVSNTVPEGPVTHDFRISYYIHLDKEPCLAEVNNIKNITFDLTKVHQSIFYYFLFIKRGD